MRILTDCLPDPDGLRFRRTVTYTSLIDAFHAEDVLLVSFEPRDGEPKKRSEHHCGLPIGTDGEGWVPDRYWQNIGTAIRFLLIQLYKCLAKWVCTVQAGPDVGTKILNVSGAHSILRTQDCKGHTNYQAHIGLQGFAVMTLVLTQTMEKF